MNNAIIDPATYAQPETEYKTVQLTVRADQVRAGDVRLKTQGNRTVTREVAEVKVGTKWVYLRDAQGKTIDELPLEAGVLVQRTQQTEDSAQAQHRAYQNRKLAQTLAGRSDGVQSALARVTEQITEYGAADYNAISGLLAAQAQLKVHNELVGMALTEKYEDLVAAAHAFAERLKNQLVQDVRHRALSRSTSVVSNLLEDCDREAMAKFIDDMRWV